MLSLIAGTVPDADGTELLDLHFSLIDLFFIFFFFVFRLIIVIEFIALSHLFLQACNLR